MNLITLPSSEIKGVAFLTLFTASKAALPDVPRLQPQIARKSTDAIDEIITMNIIAAISIAGAKLAICRAIERIPESSSAP